MNTTLELKMNSASRSTRFEVWSRPTRVANGVDESRSLLSDWPMDRPRTWVAIVNRAQNDGKERAIRRSLRKGQPVGSHRCIAGQRYDLRLQLEHSRRFQASPKKL